uniref:Uncharacterized protein n=1 Tax=Sphaerodactylus townsendi TaxID=933632 RepID=A0ACB8FFV1_9SAUR
MAPTSFDDQYKGCEDKMAANLKELNRTEFDNNRIFAKAWQLAEREISLSPPAGLKQEYAIALAAYTIQQPNLYEVFNKAVTEAGKNTDYYLNSFHFKTFHFLLTRAIQVLGAKAAPKCYSVYRGVKKFLVPGGSKMIRFGHFTSSSLKREVALQFGEDTFFTIETCRGVSIKAISFYPEEDEVLIPPYEKFEVIKFTKTPNTNFIHLRSLGESTTYNCVFVKDSLGSTSKSLDCYKAQ